MPMMRLLHHTALASLFATFGLGVNTLRPSVLMPCDYRMLQNQAKQQAVLVIFDTIARSQKKGGGLRHLFLSLLEWATRRTFSQKVI